VCGSKDSEGTPRHGGRAKKIKGEGKQVAWNQQGQKRGKTSKARSLVCGKKKGKNRAKERERG
jgi:hypothetical protein